MQWLDWVRRLQTMSQAGLTYTQNPYDRERYVALQALAGEITSAFTGGPLPEVTETIRAERGYATPKLDIRAVVERGGQLLFMRESQDGLWSLPGGWADIGESPSQIAEREVLEETGYRVRAVKLLAVYDKARHEHPPEFWYCYKLFLRCELLGGEPSFTHETLDVGFFPEDALPPLSTNRVTERQVRRMFEHLAHPEYPTDFD